MNRRTFLKNVPALTILAAARPSFTEAVKEKTESYGEAVKAALPPTDLQPIALLPPQTDGGKSVLAALKERKTIRTIRDEKLSAQMLSNLLWAAWGVNRQSGPFGQIGRTAASASNSQEIDLYVVLPEGTYLYEAVNHRLDPVVAGDLRVNVSAHDRGGTMTKAPVILIYVVDIAKYSKSRLQEPGLKDTEIQKSYYNVATGLIAGNVYLFAASQNLAAWFHNCNKQALAAELKLRPEQRVLYGQTVGLPA
ncbi:MAG TPA: nitroreductase family protein [Sedimentisphaerales bacterium]